MESEFSIRQETTIAQFGTNHDKPHQKGMPPDGDMLGMCILISAWLAAQTDAAKNPNNTKSEAQTVGC